MGPILLRAQVPIYDGDTAEALAERVLVIEHRTYPKAIQLHVDNRAKIENNKSVVDKTSDGWEKKWNEKRQQTGIWQTRENAPSPGGHY